METVEISYMQTEISYEELGKIVLNYYENELKKFSEDYNVEVKCHAHVTTKTDAWGFDDEYYNATGDITLSKKTQILGNYQTITGNIKLNTTEIQEIISEVLKKENFELKLIASNKKGITVYFVNDEIKLFDTIKKSLKRKTKEKN